MEYCLRVNILAFDDNIIYALNRIMICYFCKYSDKIPDFTVGAVEM